MAAQMAARAIGYLNNMAAGGEEDNCVGLKLAKTRLRLVPLCSGRKTEPDVLFQHRSPDLLPKTCVRAQHMWKATSGEMSRDVWQQSRLSKGPLGGRVLSKLCTEANRHILP